MAYENFGVVKTLVLPVPDTNLTIDEYKEQFGIDLREYIYLQSNFIGFDFKNCVVYLQEVNNSLGANMTAALKHCVFPVADINYAPWVSGSDNGFLRLGIRDDVQEDISGIAFEITNNKDFTLENLEVNFYGA